MNEDNKLQTEKIELSSVDWDALREQVESYYREHPQSFSQPMILADSAASQRIAELEAENAALRALVGLLDNCFEYEGYDTNTYPRNRVPDEMRYPADNKDES